MQLFEKLAEEKIIAALQRGEFDDLPGAGKPLPSDNLSHVPEELRMAYTVLKNAGYVPPELALRREISGLELQVGGCMDRDTKQPGLKKLFYLYMQLDESGGGQANLALQDQYYRKVVQRLSGT